MSKEDARTRRLFDVSPLDRREVRELERSQYLEGLRAGERPPPFGRRRLFPLAVSVLTAVGATGPAALLMTPRRAVAIDPVTALSFGVTAVKLFTNSAPSPMSLMLRAINDKIDIMAGQIANIQDAVANLSLAVGALPNVFESILDARDTRHIIESINAVGGEWRELFDAGWTPEEAYAKRRSQVEAMLGRMRAARHHLTSNRRGADPLAGIILPMALGLEGHLTLLVDGEDQAFWSMGEGYRAWLAALRDLERQDSAANQRLMVSTQLARRLDAISKNPAARASGFSIATRASTGAGVSRECVRHYTPASRDCAFLPVAFASGTAPSCWSIPAWHGPAQQFHHAWRIVRDTSGSAMRTHVEFVQGVADLPAWARRARPSICQPIDVLTVYLKQVRPVGELPDVMTVYLKQVRPVGELPDVIDRVPETGPPGGRASGRHEQAFWAARAANSWGVRCPRAL